MSMDLRESPDRLIFTSRRSSRRTTYDFWRHKNEQRINPWPSESIYKNDDSTTRLYSHQIPKNHKSLIIKRRRNRKKNKNNLILFEKKRNKDIENILIYRMYVGAYLHMEYAHNKYII